VTIESESVPAVIAMSTDLDALNAAAVPRTGGAGRRPFGAAKALASFALLLGAQMVAGVVIMLFAAVIAIAKGQDAGDPAFSALLIRQITVPLLLSVCVVSSVVIFATARLWAWDAVLDRSRDGIGLTHATRMQVLSCSLIGIASGAAYLAVGQWLVPFDPSTPLGPLASAASAGGLYRIAWALFALAYAPLVEEFFFRGMLLRGLTASWGASLAGVGVTILFVLSHLSETIIYWPATVAILALSVATLAARRVTGSIYPAVALHGGYNFVLVLFVFAGGSAA
jgi:membrane protease YdiL (CAAX protease family)